jgi:4-diphosphocytidyl-2-C-methyl-D-erythritol kinase
MKSTAEKNPVSALVVFPNCKINLGLHVLEKRSDGYHNLETIFLPLSLKDALEVNNCTHKGSASGFDLSVSGLAVPGEPDANLCTKAWQLLKNDYPDVPPIKMHLLKAIPTGAGLAGGSSDGAFTLLLLDRFFGLGLGQEKLIEYALQLGSDCPFFIINKPCLAAGRGEILEELPLDLSDYKIVVVYPDLHINTGWAFSQLRPAAAAQPLKEIIQKPIQSWREKLGNDFEEPVFDAHPALRKIKDTLYQAGALYASMTGTGSCIFGIFRKKGRITNLRLDDPNKVYYLHSQ